VVLLLDEGHRCLTATADGTGLPLQEGARGVCLEELGAVLVNAGYKEGHTVGTSHGLTLLSLVAFSEVNCEVTDGLCDLFNGHRFCVIKAVILGFNASMIYQDACISDNATHSASTVSVNL
jgi:hypothetical protein